MFASIRYRLTLSHLLVIVIAMGLSGFLLLSFLDSYFVQAAEDSLLAQARIIAQALLPSVIPTTDWGEQAAVDPGLIEGLESNAAANTLQQRQLSNLTLQTGEAEAITSTYELDFLDDDPTHSRPYNLSSRMNSSASETSVQLSAELTTYIRVLDARGMVVLDSLGQPLGASLRSNSLVSQALAGTAARRIESDGNMYLAYPAMDGDAVLGVVYLSQPMDDVAAVLHDLQNRWLISTGVAVLFSALLGLFLSGAMARPLRRLTLAAGAVAQGRFDLEVPVQSRDELGRLSRAFNDMTQRLRAARQMQVDFVANVSHELRTPLTAVKGTVETLRDGAVDDPEVRDRFLGTVESETDRMIRLVNDLLLLSRTDSAALNLKLAEVDLTDFIPQTVEKLRAKASKKEIEIDIDLEPDCPAVWADRDRLEQVLLNLLDNAIKYSHRGGKTAINVWHNPNSPEVVVEVWDEGVGIPAEDLPNIGRRFYRAEKARSRAHGGSGLGVAIAQALVRAHGGELWLESEEGKGTIACFSLPPSSP